MSGHDDIKSEVNGVARALAEGAKNAAEGSEEAGKSLEETRRLTIKLLGTAGQSSTGVNICESSKDSFLQKRAQKLESSLQDAAVSERLKAAELTGVNKITSKQDQKVNTRRLTK